MLVKVIQPCKVARCGSWEYLWTGLLIESRNIVGIKEEITVLVFFFTCASPFGPLMLFGSMVHNEIKADVDAAFMAFGGKL